MSNKLGSPESLNSILTSRINVIKTWDKKDAIKYMLPQRIEDGKVYNFYDRVIMSYADGENCVFHEDGAIVDDAGRVTEKLLNDLYSPVDAYFSVEAGETVEAKLIAVDDVEADETVEDKDIPLIDATQAFINDGKFKKAKKFLKANEDHADYKTAKKMLKTATK